MNNLTINGVDYNAELDLLKLYMNEWIENYNTFMIDLSALKNNLTPTELISLYKQKGVILLDVREATICPIEAIELFTFEKWKRRNELINLARHRRSLDIEARLSPLLPKDCFKDDGQWISGIKK